MDIEATIKEEYLESKHDLDKLKNFYNKYNYLRHTEIANILKLNLSTIYRQRQKCGLVIAGQKRINKIKNYEILETMPIDWRKPEWLIPAVDKYGVRQIAKKAGLNLRYVYSILNENGWSVKQIHHECNNFDWLYYHYVRKEWTLQKMAKKASVSLSTMRQWLIDHGFYEKGYQGFIIPIWIKELKHRLEQHPVVRRVFIRRQYLKVCYYSHIVERFYWCGQRPDSIKCFFIKPDMLDFSKAKTFIYEYGVGLDGEIHHPAHIKIDKNMKGLNTVEKRLTIHSFLAEITKRKYVHMTHPREVLDEDLARCRTCNVDHYFADKTLYAVSCKLTKESAGHLIAEHFFRFSFGPYICCKKLSHQRFLSFRRFTKLKKRLPWSFRQLMRFICFDYKTKYLYGRKIRFYRDFGSVYTIFKKFNITGNVLDLSPGYGYNALSAAIAGIEYKYLPEHKIGDTLNNGFADFVGLKHSVYDGDSSVDLLLCHSFNVPDMELVKKYYTKAKRIIVFVPGYIKDEFVSKYKPEYLITYKRNKTPSKPDFLAIW